tara:strand:- start:145 stop:774 length:630 start_codon:yes stop_codon:yes gene_type:complete
MAEVAFVLGNGESRKGIDINDLKEKGTVFACNGVYRTHQPHFLIAVDPKMIFEIAETDYMLHNKVWSNFNAQYNKNSKILDHVQWFKPSLGWSSGPTALRMACDHGFKEIYILGFDYQGLSEGDKNNRFKVNNLFKDTRNYKKSNEQATFFGNWMNQTKKCLQDYKDVKFHRVIPTGWYQPKDLAWKGNIEHPSTDEFLDKFKLQVKSS